MSKFDELKKQHKDLALSDLDLIKMTVPDQASKYVEVLAKLAKIKYKEIAEQNSGEGNLRTACLSVLTEWGVDYNYLETLETPVLWAMWNRMETLLGQNNFKMFLKFANLNERKLIENNDVTSYKSFDEIETAVSLAEMKLIDKELEKQIIKVYEDDEWLSIKPLSLEASMKYGASTKWCTTMDRGTYFARYSRWGILIYALNKKTGYKFASFKNLDRDRDAEFSFWNPADHKIDPLDTMEISTEILSVIRNEVNINRVTNKSLMDEAAQKKLYAYENPEDDQAQPIQPEGELRFTISASSSPYFGTVTDTASNNIGMGITAPNTQLEIGGDIVVREGSIRMTDNEGVERIRITSNGFEMPGAIASSPYSEQIEQTRQDLFREMEQHLERAEEHVVQQREVERDTLLRNIELGTLDENYIKRMQQLAGIDIDGVTVKLNGVEIVDEGEAEQPVVHSKHNWIDKIKSGYEKIKVHIRRLTMGKGTEQPI